MQDRLVTKSLHLLETHLLRWGINFKLLEDVEF